MAWTHPGFSRRRARAIEAVAMVFGIEPDVIVEVSPRPNGRPHYRTRTIARARQVAMAAIWRHGNLGRMAIGRLFDRDMTTVLGADRAVKARIAAGDPITTEAWERALDMLGDG